MMIWDQRLFMCLKTLPLFSFIPTQSPKMIYCLLVSPATIHSPVQCHAIEGSDDLAPTYLVNIICQTYSLTTSVALIQENNAATVPASSRTIFHLVNSGPYCLHLGFPSNYLIFAKSKVQLWSFYKHLLFLFTPSLTEHLNESKICHKTNEWILQSRNRLTGTENNQQLPVGRWMGGGARKEWGLRGTHYHV